MLEIIFNAIHGIFIEELPFWIGIIAVFLICSKISSTNAYLDFKEKARQFMESAGWKISDIFDRIGIVIRIIIFVIVIVIVFC